MAAVPPSRNVSRHPERVAATTPSSRERVSRSSPRRSRRTASVFRLAENRPRSWLSVLVLFLGISGTPSRTIMVQGGVQRKPQAKDHLTDGLQKPQTCNLVESGTSGRRLKMTFDRFCPEDS